MCELIGVALHDKDGSMEWMKSTWGYSFYFSSVVIVLMDTGDARGLSSNVCIDQWLLVECWRLCLNGSAMWTVECGVKFMCTCAEILLSLWSLVCVFSNLGQSLWSEKGQLSPKARPQRATLKSGLSSRCQTCELFSDSFILTWALLFSSVHKHTKFQYLWEISNWCSFNHLEHFSLFTFYGEAQAGMLPTSQVLNIYHSSLDKRCTCTHMLTGLSQAAAVA